MYKKILKKFFLVIVIALSISGVLSCVMVNTIMTKQQTTDMLYTLKLIDSNIDYSLPMQGQVERINGITLTDDSRITIIDFHGNVCADTSVNQTELLENHLSRKEVQTALHSGTGYSKRVSETTGQKMLYTCYKANDYIVRLSIPFEEFAYIKTLIPILLASIIIAFIIAGVIAWHLTRSITAPLTEIAREFSQDGELNFKNYEYDELNYITSSASNLSSRLKNAMEGLKQAQQVRQDFFANASHELKTPITSIQGYAELLDEGINIDPSTEKIFISRIKAEARNMTNLINDILEISKLELKKDSSIMMDVNVESIIEDMLKSYEPMIKEHKLTVSVKCKDAVIPSNPKHIQQLINNLISNSIKYNHDGGIVNIETGVRQNTTFYFRIQDTGIGIPESSRERVFERFYRVDKGRSRKMGGTGLGLSIVNHIVQYYNGRIFLESEENKGTDMLIEWDIYV